MQFNDFWKILALGKYWCTLKLVYTMRILSIWYNSLLRTVMLHIQDFWYVHTVLTGRLLLMIWTSTDPHLQREAVNMEALTLPQNIN
jgi:hypothetical protein